MNERMSEAGIQPRATNLSLSLSRPRGSRTHVPLCPLRLGLWTEKNTQ